MFCSCGGVAVASIMRRSFICSIDRGAWCDSRGSGDLSSPRVDIAAVVLSTSLPVLSLQRLPSL
jgi:hypothetical protein